MLDQQHGRVVGQRLDELRAIRRVAVARALSRLVESRIFGLPASATATSSRCTRARFERRVATGTFTSLAPVVSLDGEKANTTAVKKTDMPNV